MLAPLTEPRALSEERHGKALKFGLIHEELTVCRLGSWSLRAKLEKEGLVDFERFIVKDRRTSQRVVGLDSVVDKS